MVLSYKYGDGIKSTNLTTSELEIAEQRENGRYTVTVKALKDISLLSAGFTVKHTFGKDDLIFANGYQSWTQTKEFTLKEGINNLDKLPGFLAKKYAFKSYGSQMFEKYPKGTLTAFDIMYVKGKNPLFIGNYNYKNAYLIINVYHRSNTVEVKSDVYGKFLKNGETYQLFDCVISTDITAAKEEYLGKLQPKTTDKLFGYTSWYNHYTEINENIIETALSEADDRFDLFQIDDGFEPFVGDWMETDAKKFPNGLEPIVKKIHDRGMKAGIWLAPFAVEKNSNLYKSKPEYIKKDSSGKMILAGGNWSGFYPLDLDNNGAVEYVRTVLKKYVAMGFDFFKLDFLYVSNLSRMEGKTKAETAEFAYNLLCEELEGKIILGCGATISNAFGKFDYMRIGPDVSLKFDDSFIMRRFHPERPSTKVTLCNTIFRYILNNRAFGNDPDVFLLRDDNISLTKQQRYALTVINALFGNLFMTSDNPKKYDKEKLKTLNFALDLSKNATVTGYERVGNTVQVSYLLNKVNHYFEYDIDKGIIRNER